MKRLLVVLTAASLVAGAFAATPAQAKRKKKKPKGVSCQAFAPVEPSSDSGQTAEVLETPVVRVTDAHTEEAPLEFSYEHGPALWTITQTPIEEDTVFFNIQIVSSSPSTGMNIRQEWGTPSFSDMDLYVYDGTGAQVFNSGSVNIPEPLGGPDGALPDSAGQKTGAAGYESISDAAVTQCAGFTIESRAFTTMGEDMTMKVWLAPITA